MTKQLEDELGLPYLDDILKMERDAKEAEEIERLKEVEQEMEDLRKDEPETAASFETSLCRAQQIENELADHNGLRVHDSEMDEISKEAMESYQEFKDLALNCTPAHAGKISETAVNMLRIALDARNSKSDKKLKMWRLQLDQARLLRDLERDQGDEEGVIDSEDAIRIDRNKLLKEIHSTLYDDDE